MVVAMLCIVPTSEVKIINLIYAKVLKLLKAFLVASRQTHYSKSVIFVQKVIFLQNLHLVIFENLRQNSNSLLACLVTLFSR